MDERDVVVVGAGPAGASAGFFLKNGNEDLDVVMIDRLDGDKYSRYHRMCGEAISHAAFRELAPLRPTNIVHHITKVREEWPGGKVVQALAIGATALWSGLLTFALTRLIGLVTPLIAVIAIGIYLIGNKKVYSKGPE